jgi:hypothetical protein
MFTQKQELLLQRMPSDLMQAVDYSGSYRGESAEVIKQYGSAKARVGNEDRNGDTPNFNISRDQRWCFPVTADWGTTFAKIDELKVLVDETSPVNQAAHIAMKNSIDTDILIPAFFADAKTGKGAATTTVYPASANDIAITVGNGGSGNVGLNVAKLIEARRLARKKRWMIGREPIFVGITSQQESDLMNDTKYIDRDYGEPVLDGDGRLKKFYGFEFVVLEEWPWASNIRSCPVWTKSAIHLGAWDSLSVNLAPNPQKKFVPTLYMFQMFGATRTQEDKVLRIQCADTTGP